MNEHDDDLEPDVEEYAEYETAEFRPSEVDEESGQGAQAVSIPDDEVLDPDDSEL
jgi:hypothetical protein